MKIYAAVDCETSGLDPRTHDVMSIAILPLNEDFSESNIEPFVVQFKQSKTVDCNAIAVNSLNPNDGLEKEEGMILFKNWLNANEIEQIIPVGWNIQFDLSFIKENLPEVGEMFSYHHRDVMQLAEILNDLHRIRKDKELFHSCSLGNVLRSLGFSTDGEHSALIDAKNTAKVYRHMLGML